MSVPFISFSRNERTLDALVAQSVERVLGKDEVGSSSLLGGSSSLSINNNNKNNINYG